MPQKRRIEFAEGKLQMHNEKGIFYLCNQKFKSIYLCKEHLRSLVVHMQDDGSDWEETNSLMAEGYHAGKSRDDS